MASDIQPLVTREPVPHTTRYEPKTWTYDEIFEIWDEDSDDLVPQLVRRCMAYEEQLATAHAELERLRAELAVEQHENGRWEGICDELERERDEARQLARMYWQLDRRHQLTFEQDHLSERHPWLTEEPHP